MAGAVHIILTSGESFHAIGSTPEQLVDKIRQGQWFDIRTDSLPGGNATMKVRPGAVAAITEQQA